VKRRPGTLAAMPTYRLRIELPDRPGALASVSAVLAEHGANILSIDVHEVDGGTAVDEIVVEGPDGWIPSPVAAALAESGVGSLLSSRRMANIEDAVTAALRAVSAMVASPADDLDSHCSAAVLQVASGASAHLISADEAADVQEGSVVHRIEHGWQLAAVDDETDPQTVAIVTRPLNVRFSATEISRVEALLRIRRRLVAARGVATGS
jgi:hypothetical protein